MRAARTCLSGAATRAGPRHSAPAQACRGQGVKRGQQRSCGKLLVGNSETSPPFSSRENGKIVGYDIDLAAQVANRLGVPRC